MDILRIFKKKSELEEYMEILNSSGTSPMPPWMSMTREDYERAHEAYEEHLKTIGE